MNKLFLTCLLAIICHVSFAQIQNADFEVKPPHKKTLIPKWAFFNTEGFKISLVKSTHASGKTSLQIQSIAENKKGLACIFLQRVPFKTTNIKRIAIIAFIKTDNARGNAGLFCFVSDKQGKQIGYQDLALQDNYVSGNTNWKQYRLNIILSDNSQGISFGGYLKGAGRAWFDDFCLTIDNRKNTTAASASVNRYIKEFTDIVKQNSIYNNQLNWQKITQNINKLSGGLKTIGEAQFICGYVLDELRALGDYHSFLQPKVTAIVSAQKNTSPQKPSAKLLPNNIGYVYVPAFGSTSDTAGTNFAQNIQNMIRRLDSENDIKHWIVDLRENGGGNMYPMIAGLGPLIGNGNLGYFILPKSQDKVGVSWFYKDGCSGTNNNVLIRVPSTYKLKKSAPKIAVLIGPHTTSSGEMTAISFIGKPNIKLIGKPTGGYTTGNQGHKLSDGSYLYIASNYCTDRNNKKYIDKIQPDIVVNVKSQTGEDATIKVAQNWLLKK